MIQDLHEDKTLAGYPTSSYPVLHHVDSCGFGGAIRTAHERFEGEREHAEEDHA